MNTPAHLLLGAAAFGRGGGRGVMGAALLGGLLPDLSLYVMAGVSLTILGISPSVVFNELYFSDAWQTVFAIDNSFILWGLCLGLALWSRKPWAIALCSAALLHVALDFPLHHDDGRPHFWPLSDWVFESPVSYWDMRHGAGWVGPIEVALCALALVVLVMARPEWLFRIGFVALFALEVRTVIGWFQFIQGA